MHDHVPGVLARLGMPALHSQFGSRGTPHTAGTVVCVCNRSNVFRVADKKIGNSMAPSWDCGRFPQVQRQGQFN